MYDFDTLPLEIVDKIIDYTSDFKDMLMFSLTAKCYKKYKPGGFEFGKFLLVKALSNGLKNKKTIGFRVRYPACKEVGVIVKYMEIHGSLVHQLESSQLNNLDDYFIKCLDKFELDDAKIWDLKITPWYNDEHHHDIKKAISLIRKKEAEEGEYGFVSHLF